MRSPMWNVKVKVWWFFHHGRGVALARRVARTKATLTRMWRWIQPFSARTIAETQEFTRLAAWFALVLRPRKKEDSLWVEYPIRRPDYCIVRFVKQLFRLTIMPMGWVLFGEDPWYDVEVLGTRRSDLERAQRDLRYYRSYGEASVQAPSVRMAVYCLRTEDMSDTPLLSRLLREVLLWLTRDLESLSPGLYFDLDKERFAKQDAAAHGFSAFVQRLTGVNIRAWAAEAHSVEIRFLPFALLATVDPRPREWRWGVSLAHVPLFDGLFIDVGLVRFAALKYDAGKLARVEQGLQEGSK